MADAALLRERAKYANRIGMEREFDDLSFGAAFNKAKREGRSDFPWRGETYSTKTAEEQGREIAAKAAAGSGRGAFAGRTAANRDTAPTPSAPPTLRSLLGTAAPEVKEDALTRIAGRTPARRPEEEIDAAKNRTLAALSLMGGLGANVGLRTLAGRMGAGRAAPAATRRGSRRSPDEELQDRIEPPFKKGGKVKPYASGGSVKGAGCERRGLRKCKVY